MKQHIERNCDYHIGIDRMINEGLGGGFILYEYDLKKYERTKKETKDH